MIHKIRVGTMTYRKLGLVFIFLTLCFRYTSLEPVPDNRLASTKTDYAKFTTFMNRYKKHYNTEAEKNKRLKIFTANLKTIEESNKNEKGSAKYGINQWTDLTWKEFRNRTMKIRPRPRRTLKSPNLRNHANIASTLGSPKVVIPETYDWRDNNPFYPPTEHQLECASSYAFVAANALGIIYSKAKKQQTSFSKQQILDCGKNNGCSGGQIGDTLEYLKDPGLMLASYYKYEGVKGHCRADKLRDAAKIESFHRIWDEGQMERYVPCSPVITGVNAEGIRFYKSGVIDQTSCSTTINHYILAVGYNKDSWIIRNSWGPSWGTNGHGIVKKGKKICGIGSDAYGIRTKYLPWYE